MGSGSVTGDALFPLPPVPDPPDDDPPAPASIGWVEAVRDRRRLVRPAGRWVGIGRDAADQPDLFVATFRVGWWFWDISPLHAELGLVERIAELRRALLETRALLKGDGGMKTP